MTHAMDYFKFQISNVKSRKPARGFTLVEVLVVIAIIGMLVAMLVPAINAARRQAKRTLVKADMTQLMLALEDFRTKVGGGQYPPDGTNSQDTQRFLKAAFPRTPWGNGVAYPTNITPDTALVFWLGGAQDSTGAFVGFSANPLNPFDNSGSRIPVSFEFDRSTSTTRFVQKGTLQGPTLPPTGTATSVTWNLFQYFPLNGNALTSNMPYLYFKAVAASYTQTAFSINVTNGLTGTTLPYKDSTSPNGNAFVNPTKFQLLCPGLDGKYGNYTGTTYPLYPSGTNYDATNGLDDMTNFTTGATVGDDTN